MSQANYNYWAFVASHTASVGYFIELLPKWRSSEPWFGEI